MTTVLTPIDLSAATQAGPRVYRKQVLKKGTIRYPLPTGGHRTVTFDDAYLTDLAAAYKAGAYDVVPFQLADPANRHNEDPRNYGGRVLGAEVTGDGLDLILELSEDTADLVERTGRRLGVSARIKEALEHVDGRRFPRAIRHVLGTLDPRMTGMRPWEPVVDLSAADDDEVLDLSAYTYQGDTMHGRKIDLSKLSDDELESLESWAIVNGIDLSAAADEDGDTIDGPGDDEPYQDDEPADDEPADDGDKGDEPADVEPLSEAELDALLEDALKEVDAEDREPAEVSLSNEDEEEPEDGWDSIDLAAGMVSDAADTARVARDDAAEARFDLARERYGAAGVPPYLLDLARPILELSDDSDVLELSSPATGDPIDVRGIVTGLLDAFRGTVDLSTEDGYSHESPDEQQQGTADAWTAYLENN